MAAAAPQRAVKLIGVKADAVDLTAEQVQELNSSSGGWRKCPVPALLGIPLAMKQLAPTTAATRPTFEQPAVFMLIDPRNGFAPPDVQLNGLGEVLLARTDGEQTATAAADVAYGCDCTSWFSCCSKMPSPLTLLIMLHALADTGDAQSAAGDVAQLLYSDACIFYCFMLPIQRQSSILRFRLMHRCGCSWKNATLLLYCLLVLRAAVILSTGWNVAARPWLAMLAVLCNQRKQTQACLAC
jgi:hypothetical protein